MKRLFFHIGFHKTGTTAFQTWCWMNRSKLLEYGLFYPSTGVPTNKPYHREFFTNSQGAAWDSLHTEANENSADRILMSDEAWSGPWVERHKMECLKLHLAPYDVSILCVLRNPADYYVSRYRHQIRMGSDTSGMSFRKYVEEKVPKENEYLSQLELWASVFGRGKINVIIYEQAKLNDGLGRELLARCGLQIKDVRLPQSNVHWDDDRLKTLRMAQRIDGLTFCPHVVAKRLRSAGLGRLTSTRRLVRAAIGMIDPLNLVPQSEKEKVKALCEEWPIQLKEAGWLDDKAARALAKS